MNDALDLTLDILMWGEKASTYKFKILMVKLGTPEAESHCFSVEISGMSGSVPNKCFCAVGRSLAAL